MRMRSALGSHYAGSGIIMGCYDDVDYYPLGGGCSVKLECDIRDKKEFDAYCKAMSGEVKVYSIEELKTIN